MVAAHLASTRFDAPGAILITITLMVAAIVAIAERVHPAHLAWNQSRGDVGTDLVHTAVSQAMIPKLVELGLVAALLGAATHWEATFDGGPWPSHWPLAVQLGLALVVSQFGEYWVHRWSHTTPWLWRLHATHHSPHRLYFLNASRFHPLDTTLSVLVSLTPLILLGVGPEAMLLLTVWVAVHGMFQHCNIDLRLGPLNYIFSMAELHRWHHSKVTAEANHNYGNNIIFWDLVFGTFYWPRDRPPPVDVGLEDMPGFPQRYLGQLLSPFRWGQTATAATARPTAAVSATTKPTSDGGSSPA